MYVIGGGSVVQTSKSLLRINFDLNIENAAVLACFYISVLLQYPGDRSGASFRVVQTTHLHFKCARL